MFLVFQRVGSLEVYSPEYAGDSFWFSVPIMFIRINRNFVNSSIHIKNDHELLISLLLIWSLYDQEHTTDLTVPLTIILLSAVFTCQFSELYSNTGATIKLQNVNIVARKDKQHHHQQQQQMNKSLLSGTCSAKHIQKVLDAYVSRSFVHQRIASAVKRVEFASDRTSYILERPLE